MLSADPDIEVVGEAATGFQALERINAHNPDLVTLDVDMPGMDGLSTLRCLRQRRPDLPVIMMSVLTQEGARTTLDALASGAVDFVDKTRLNLMDFGQLSRELLDKIKTWLSTGFR